MKPLVVFGDVHQTPKSLEKLLSDPLVSGADKFSLGDIFDKGHGDINECFDLLIKHNVQMILGNHEEPYLNFLKKNRSPSSIRHDGKRATYQKLSETSKEYLRTAKSFIQLESVLLVHAGIGPHHIIQQNLNGKTFNEILRLRYVDKNSLEHVSTIHNKETHTWGPAHENVWRWQEVYNRRYGCVIYGHNIDSKEWPICWFNDHGFEYSGWIMPNDKTEAQMLKLSKYKAIGLDTGAYKQDGHLTAIIIKNDDFSFIRVPHA